jgi:hypothetical protein
VFTQRKNEGRTAEEATAPDFEVVREGEAEGTAIAATFSTEAPP